MDSRGPSVTMFVYEISERRGRIPSESRTGKPRKKVMSSVFKTPKSFVLTSEGVGL